MIDLTLEELNSPNINRIIANKLKGLKAKAEGTHKGEKNGRYGKPVKQTTRKKLRKAKLGQKHTEEAKRKSARPGKLNGMYGVRLTGDQNGFYQKTHTKKVKNKLKNAALNRKEDNHCIHCNGYYTAQAYKQHHGDRCKSNPNYKERVFKSGWKNGDQDTLTCPHCEFIGGKVNMRRYHMDKCEFKGHYIASYVDNKQIKVYTNLQSILDDGINWHKVRNCLHGKSKRAYKMEWAKISKKK